jgi:hypothetical protein
MSMTTMFHLERSKYDIKHFYEWLGYNFGEHIGEWLDLYGDRGDREVHRVCIIAPRDHSKSTTLRIKALHMLLFERWRNKPFTIWLFSASKELAANRLEEIREDLKQHKELSRMIDEKRGNKLELRLTNGAWIKATSVGSAIRGEHPSSIILDDVLDDTNDMSDAVVRHWFRKKLTPMLSPKTNIFCVGTPMSMNDLYHTEMLNNDAWVSWSKGSITNYDEWRADPEKVEPVCLWPQERPLSFLLEQRKAIGELAFAQEYLCKVVDDDSAVFPQTLTRKNLDMRATLEVGKCHNNHYIIGFDPSHGIGQDYSVMIAVRQDSEGCLHVVNIWRRNDFPPNKQIDTILEWNEAYGRPTFAFESAGFQSLYQSILAQRNATVDVRESKVSNRKLKQGLLTRMRVWFEQGKIFIPYGNDKTRQEMNILLQELETHVWNDGIIVDKGKHNDTTMALAHAIDFFRNKTGDLPMLGGKADMTSWTDGQKKTSSTKRSGKSGKYISFF